MQSFSEKIAGIGWTTVLRSDSTPVEKLDALSWVHTNALAQFGDEFRIQLAWMRQSPPPDTPNIAWLFTKRLRQMKSVLVEGIRAGGEIAIDSPSNEVSHAACSGGCRGYRRTSCMTSASGRRCCTYGTRCCAA